MILFQKVKYRIDDLLENLPEKGYSSLGSFLWSSLATFHQISMIISCYCSLVLKMESQIPHRKKLWFAIREKYPQLVIKVGKDFEKAVRERLLDLLKFNFPLTEIQDQFLSNEVHNFSRKVPDFWQKCKRNQTLFFRKHKDFFGKVYPDDVLPDHGSSGPSKAIKRPHELKSRTQQWRDNTKIAKEDKKAVLGALKLVYHKEGDKDALYVLKRLEQEPQIAKDLRKAIKDKDEMSNDRLICFCSW